ncbi:MAG: hypothetical protein OWU84_13715 [Firmicutes bacterium]|nr:hypothetical protein [Bacillota bacterium]
MLYIDTANVDEARQALQLGIVSGITTNPTLMRRISDPEPAVIDALLSLSPAQLFIQLRGTTRKELEDHRQRIRGKWPNAPIVFKLVPTWEAMQFAALWREQETFLITAVNSVQQAYVAREAGAQYVAVYLHRYRLRHGTWPPLTEIRRVVGSHVRIMIASCHSMAEVQWAMVNEADDLTLPLSLLQQLLVNTDSAEDIARFNRDGIKAGSHSPERNP